MSEMYKSLTDFLPMLEDDKIRDWVIDRGNAGIPYPDAVCELYKNCSGC